VAFHAALTGHLVLSTLHTNSAIAAITRLRDMGLASYVIADAMMGVVAQRLVRRLCPHCRVEQTPDPAMRQALKIAPEEFTAYKSGGCAKCNHLGYKGRVGVYEIFPVDPEIKQMIHRDATEPELLHTARMTGMTTLLDDALAKVKAGLTTCEEVLRVFGPQNTVEIVCPHCQALMDQRHPFCPYCGRPSITTCDRCKQLLARDWRFCPQCGAGVGKAED
jgi:type II secretory ATPase GspE/PulE/Tfp pilus assembly ATPase PilB-like protein/RNA polymerase subunit RPABC4/transcription elongation factor Spt4